LWVLARRCRRLRLRWSRRLGGIDRDVHQPGSELFAGVAARGEQQVDVELRKVDRGDVARSLTDDNCPDRLTIEFSDPQPTAADELVDKCKRVGTARPRSLAPLARLAALDEPRHSRIEQIEKQRRVGDAAVANVQRPTVLHDRRL
jgi:hypothetical protein